MPARTKFRDVLTFATIFVALSPICAAQGNPKPESATTAVLGALETHDIVMWGEIHGNKQEYEWLRSLVVTPQFADRVDDIVVEFGNSLYQKSVDRYLSGEDVPLEHAQKAWRNLVGAIGPPSPVYGSFYQAVRDANLKRKGRHRIRIVCGDPYIDWDKVKDREDIAPYLGNRDQWYTQVVKEEVLAKHHHALLIMGWGHFLRVFPPGPKTPSIEQQLRSAGAKTYLIVAGPRDSLTQVFMPRVELVGTPYGKEIERRLTIEGFPASLISQMESRAAEAPQFSRPRAGSGGPPPPKNMGAPLPPRPPSQ